MKRGIVSRRALQGRQTQCGLGLQGSPPGTDQHPCAGARAEGDGRHTGPRRVVPPLSVIPGIYNMYILLLCIIPAEDNTADPVYYVLYVLVLYYVLILYYVLQAWLAIKFLRLSTLARGCSARHAVATGTMRSGVAFLLLIARSGILDRRRSLTISLFAATPGVTSLAQSQTRVARAESALRRRYRCAITC